jgi:hypothetical protein
MPNNNEGVFMTDQIAISQAAKVKAVRATPATTSNAAKVDAATVPISQILQNKGAFTGPGGHNLNNPTTNPKKR